MFKKTLLALAMAGVAGSATAATIAPDSTLEVSAQGFIALSAANQEIEIGTGLDIEDVVIDLGSNLIANDVVEIVFTGATVDTSATTGSTPTLVSSAPGGTAQFLDVQDDNTIRFRVTADFADTENAVLEGVTLRPTSTNDGAKITVASSAVSSSSAIGTYDVAAAEDVAEFDTQIELGSSFKSLNATIDVATSRSEFVDDGDVGTADDDTTDELIVDLEDAVATQFAPITFTSVVHTVVGSDLSYLIGFDSSAGTLDGDDDGVLDQDEIEDAFTISSGDDTVAVEADTDTNTLTFTQTVNGTVDDVTIEFLIPGNVTVPEQSWSATIVASDSTSNVTVASGASIGAWNNNGTTFHVPVMAIDSNHANLIVANNRSSLDANVELVLYVDGTAVNAGNIGTLAGNSSLNLSAAIVEAAAAANAGSLVGFDLVFEGTANAIDISAQYVNRTSGSRAVVQVTEL